jgi:hypothetical protein
MTTAAPLTQKIRAAAIAGVALAPANLHAAPPMDILRQETVMRAPANDRLLANTAGQSVAIDRGIITVSRALGLATSRWHGYVIRRLAELASGQYSYYQEPLPVTAACERALREAEGLFRPNTPTPSVVASDDGNVMFIWRSAVLELEIEIGSEETAVWAYDRRGGTVWSGLLEDRRAEFLGLLDSLTRP